MRSIQVDRNNFGEFCEMMIEDYSAMVNTNPLLLGIAQAFSKLNTVSGKTSIIISNHFSYPASKELLKATGTNGREVKSYQTLSLSTKRL